MNIGLTAWLFHVRVHILRLRNFSKDVLFGCSGLYIFSFLQTLCFAYGSELLMHLLCYFFKPYVIDAKLQ